MKIILVGSLSALALLALPLITSAQENQPTGGSYCPHLTRDLKYGDNDSNTGGQVTELQKFLASYYEDYPEGYITGRFRNTTKQFVIRFQREQNLPAFGYVGPLTRAAIARVCAGLTTTPPPPANPPPQNPPPAPTCTLNANPSSITLGQSSLLTWSSTNATGGSISSIGTVSANGSQSVAPTLTTTYLGTFWGTGGTAQCQTMLTVTATNTGDASCTWNGNTIAHGASVTAYQSSTVPNGQQCVSETRTCTNGTLSGSYQYASCTVAAASCTPEAPQTQTLTCPTGQTGSITQTRTSSCPGPTWGAWVTTQNTCTTPPANVQPPTVSLTISGQSAVTLAPGIAFTVAWSSSNATSCTLTNAQNQTNPTPPNTNGTSQGAAPAAGTTFTYTLSCTNAGGTTTKTASVTGQTVVAATIPSCTYKGATYAEGQTVGTTWNSISFVCDNGTWVTQEQPSVVRAGLNVCELGDIRPLSLSDFGCPAFVYRARLAISPRHGRAPLTVTAVVSPFTYKESSVSWGDGTTTELHPGDPYHDLIHTYVTPGSYTVVYRYTDNSMLPNSAGIRVDPAGTASTQNTTQLASALAALERALNAFLAL